jgi:hypothetical protein
MASFIADDVERFYGKLLKSQQIAILAKHKIYRSDVARWKPPQWAVSTDHRHDEFQPAIPWRVALQQSPPPLHRLASFCNTRFPVRKSAGSTSTQRGHFSIVVKEGTFLLWYDTF